jgi:hypothetical protein
MFIDYFHDVKKSAAAKVWMRVAAFCDKEY